MFLTYKVRLYPNEKQKNIIEKRIDDTRRIYNYFIQNNARFKGDYYLFCKELMKFDLTSLNKSELDTLRACIKELSVNLKKTDKIKEVTQDRFWHIRIKVTNVERIRLEKNKLFVTSIGNIDARFKTRGDIERVASLIINKWNDRYYASVIYEKKEERIARGEKIGIDLGVRKLVTCSNGKVYLNLEEFNSIENKIKEIQSKIGLARSKGLDSTSLRNYLDRVYLHRTNKMNDLIHKCTTELAKNYSWIVMEDLDLVELANKQVTGYMKNKFYVTSLGKLTSVLEYKCKLYGTKLTKVDRYFSSTKLCSRCHKLNEVGTSEVYQCKYCGLVIDRDLNASINIRDYK